MIVLIQRLTLLLLFFAVDGHLRLLEILVRSFEWVPLGHASFRGPFFASWSASFGALFEIGFKLAAPVTVAVWLLTLALGLIGRAAPAIFSLGFSVTNRRWFSYSGVHRAPPHAVVAKIARNLFPSGRPFRPLSHSLIDVHSGQ